MARWQGCLIVLFSVVALVGTDTYPLVGSRSTSTVLKNDCVDMSRWNITVMPDPEMQLKGVPYVQFKRGQTECEPQDTQADELGNPIYLFEFNINEMPCGMEQDPVPDNGTYRVVIVLPFRTDGIEVREDHILTFECAIPTSHWHFNESVGGIDPAFTDFNPNKTDETGVLPPTIQVKVLRGSTEMQPGDQAFLGETLTMRVEVLDEGDVYTKVKVQELWATFENQPLAGTKLDLVTSGCSLESAAIEKGIPIFENFVVVGDESVIESDFRVFRFAGQQNVYFWLTITSCSYADEETCVLCVDARRKKRALPDLALDGTSHTHLVQMPRSAFVHQIKIGEIQLMPMGRVKRETGILVPEDEADDEGSLSGLTNFQLVVYNPEELQETDGTLETENRETVVKVAPDADSRNEVCLSVTQTIIFGLLGVVLIASAASIALCLFIKLRRMHALNTHQKLLGNGTAAMDTGKVNGGPSYIHRC